MKTYIYKVIHSSFVRGYNRTIIVYRIKGNTPVHVGMNDTISTASYKGDYAVACQIISDIEGYSMSKGGGAVGAGYALKSKNIQVLEV